MEDQKLRTPYDLINSWEDLWSKETSEIRSILKELVGKVATIRPQNKLSMNENRGPSPAPPMFCDKNASIKFGRSCEKYKLSFASLYLDGEALEWYRWLFQNKKLADWKHFTAKLTSVIDYQSRFEDALLGYGDFNVLTPDIAYVSPQWSDITNSPLPQCCDE
ncbi:hypothetical protein KY290_021108 [Solanum tuberosum]|uniref:Retrotransposon gag domain-containing protein n=1 Tax=Solanum tuberosum TaxID=4113 RepID=A0ABQ7V3N9_SOLTU|nr:hypothetical protein KY289_020282 [Solanum tuberosum]KAH0692946.1 hypothetical protein KY285_020043 [Solanum tuberosum]KAH0757615.1 hypothetical protein KY290_021108 [Solanum tuberosum]